jgi:hypothetical protein
MNDDDDDDDDDDDELGLNDSSWPWMRMVRLTWT